MSYRLFLDDLRSPPSAFRPCWIARSYEAAVRRCQRTGCPSHISFDHDLGEVLTGYDFAKWLVERDLDEQGFIPAAFTYQVHSANPIGRANIEGLLNGYLAKRGAKQSPK